MSDEILIGPFILEAKVYFTDKTGQVIGNANVGIGAGKYGDEAAILRAIGQTLEALPKGCKLLDGGRFFNEVLVKEKTGRKGNFAVPASFRFDVSALTEKARAAYVPDPSDASDADEETDDDGCEMCGDLDCDGDCDE